MFYCKVHLLFATIVEVTYCIFGSFMVPCVAIPAMERNGNGIDSSLTRNFYTIVQVVLKMLCQNVSSW